MAAQYGGDDPPATFGPGVPAPACILTKHDVVLVLGCPTSPDGTPSACQRARIDLALAASTSGLGDRFIVSGAAVANAFVEAESLAMLLRERGIRDDAIVLEPKARHTDENLYFASRRMAERGWRNAIVVSDDPRHLVMSATCDANCCVGLGRLTVFDFPAPAAKLGHYVLFPEAEPIAPAECETIKPKLMCLALADRKTCRDGFALSP